MLTEICAYLKNYFCKAIYPGDYVITDGALEDVGELLKDGQYFRIVGSIFNDGVYKYPATELTDEAFSGAIWAMAVPPSLLKLADEIAAWIEGNADAINSPYQSESFEGYSYSKGAFAEGYGVYSWQGHFAAQLAQYRRLHI